MKTASLLGKNAICLILLTYLRPSFSRHTCPNLLKIVRSGPHVTLLGGTRQSRTGI
jgi:hypothetical protein